MVETEIRTPDPEDQPHEFVTRTAYVAGMAHGLCAICTRGSGHHIHDVPPAEPHAYVPWVEDGAEDRYLNTRLDEHTPDMINHPPHYTAHPSGVELRADHKGDALADLEKAAWYLAREIKRRKAE